MSSLSQSNGLIKIIPQPCGNLKGGREGGREGGGKEEGGKEGGRKREREGGREGEVRREVQYCYASISSTIEFSDSVVSLVVVVESCAPPPPLVAGSSTVGRTSSLERRWMTGDSSCKMGLGTLCLRQGGSWRF